MTPVDNLPSVDPPPNSTFPATISLSAGFGRWCDRASLRQSGGRAGRVARLDESPRGFLHDLIEPGAIAGRILGAGWTGRKEREQHERDEQTERAER